ncbi:ABC transporter permease [Candidatus Bathyarchaeota archaeon]|nr:ABC transporter permease [Candidatus Bathyarchaeota archaeon]NIU81544.1 ABC transporter permease [Candidatus Bathyarchaeota archaeon]NIV67658.1 ABC transporter permease [Candidatus Bathyarchaeota archaeon]NIW16566.1 ABC transporter permease [Candidatus Bathyarchaeota archaeon]NIW34706.1 ABC transporter permease [Candidatus Bathyarchaeota archaeon]
MAVNLPKDLRANALIIWSELLKNLKFLRAYPAVFIFWTIFPIFWFIPFILQGQAFVGGLQSAEFAELAGTSNFVAFVILGGILNSYVLTSLYGVGESVRREAYRGTLDYLLSSPCNKAFILIGKALSESISSTMYASTQLVVCILFFGIEITLGVIMPILLIVILLVLGLYGIALMLAAISLRYKQAHDLAHTLENVFYIFSPVRYPVQSLPSWAQIISMILPLTYALIAVRSLMLLRYDITAIYYEILLLFLIDVAAIFLGFYLFNWMEERTKKSGTISHY